MIACHDITFRYPGAEKPLFEGLAVDISTPGFHALFGPSGNRTGSAELGIIGMGGDHHQIEWGCHMSPQHIVFIRG